MNIDFKTLFKITILLVLYLYFSVKINNEKYIYPVNEEIKCRASTIENPMGNTLPFAENPNLNPCFESNDIILDNFYNGYLRDQNDNIAREKTRTFIPLMNKDSTALAHFLLKGYSETTIPMCKRDGIGCEMYKDLRYQI